MTTDAAKPSRGRPKINVDSEILAYVRAEQAKGRSLSSIGKSGLTIYEQCPREGGPVPVRWLRGKYLETTFRKIEEANTPIWLRPGYVGGEILFMGRAMPAPLGCAALSTRKAGRPKKSRG